MQFEFDKEIPLSSTARRRLRQFVEEFLDSSFNPLFAHLRRSIERELDRVIDSHNMQFFYLIGWFLKAECARRLHQKQSAMNAKVRSDASHESDDSFAIVAAVMNQETFILMHRYMDTAYNHKAWQDLNAGMKCFTQIVRLTTSSLNMLMFLSFLLFSKWMSCPTKMIKK
jgi:replication fork protection complex subunit Tof1/Swi1